MRFRCPNCGRGRLRTRWIDFADSCPECRHVYLPDPGDWTGAAETTFILTVASGALAFFALGAAGLAGVPRIVATFAVALALFAVLYPRVRGLWIGLLAIWIDPGSRPPPAVAPFENDPEWEHPGVLER